MELITRPNTQSITYTKQAEKPINNVAEDFTGMTTDRLEGQTAIARGMTELVNRSQAELYSIKQTTLQTELTDKSLGFQKKMSELEPWLGIRPEADEKYKALVDDYEQSMVESIDGAKLNKKEQTAFLTSSHQLVQSKKVEHGRTREQNKYRVGVENSVKQGERITGSMTQNASITNNKIDNIWDNVDRLKLNALNQATFNAYDYDTQAKAFFVNTQITTAIGESFNSALGRIGTKQENMISEGISNKYTQEEILNTLEADFNSYGYFDENTGRVELNKELYIDTRMNLEEIMMGDTQEEKDLAVEMSLESLRYTAEATYTMVQDRKKQTKENLSIPVTKANMVSKALNDSYDQPVKIEQAYNSGDITVLLETIGNDTIDDTQRTAKNVVKQTNLYTSGVENRTGVSGQAYIPVNSGIKDQVQEKWDSYGGMSYIQKVERMTAYMSELGYTDPDRQRDFMRDLSNSRDKNKISATQFDLFTYEAMKNNPDIEKYMDNVMTTSQNYVGAEPSYEASYNSYVRQTGSKLSQSEYVTASKLAYFNEVSKGGMDNKELIEYFSQGNVSNFIRVEIESLEDRMKNNPEFDTLVRHRLNGQSPQTEYVKEIPPINKFRVLATNENIINTAKDSTEISVSSLITSPVLTTEEALTLSKWVEMKRPDIATARALRPILEKEGFLESLNTEQKADVRAVEVALDFLDEKWVDNITTPVSTEATRSEVTSLNNRSLAEKKAEITDIRKKTPIAPEDIKHAPVPTGNRPPIKDTVKKFETSDGLPSVAYVDNRPNWDDGTPKLSWGFGTLAPQGTKVGDTPSPEQAEGELDYEMKQSRNDILGRTKGIKLNPNQLDALTSAYYNLGSQMFVRPDGEPTGIATALEQEDHNLVAKELQKWIYSDGKKLDGLVKRRRSEGEMYLKPVNEGDQSLGAFVGEVLEDTSLDYNIQNVTKNTKDPMEAISGLAILKNEKELEVTHHNLTYGLEIEDRLIVEQDLGFTQLSEDISNFINPEYVDPYSNLIFHTKDTVDFLLNNTPFLKIVDELDQYVTGKKNAMSSDNAWNKSLEDKTQLGVLVGEGMVSVMGITGAVGLGVSMTNPLALVGGLGLGKLLYLACNSRWGNKTFNNIVSNIYYEDLQIPTQYSNKIFSAIYDRAEEIGTEGEASSLQAPLNRGIDALKEGISSRTGSSANSSLSLLREEIDTMVNEQAEVTKGDTPKENIDNLLLKYRLTYEDIGLEADMMYDKDGYWNQDNIH